MTNLVLLVAIFTHLKELHVGAQRYPSMLLLTGLFIFRVLAQLMQAIYPLAMLPELSLIHI